jgi:uncharacterized protein (TIGR02677 family)
MEITHGLLKPVNETKYLSAENCYRYRPILRYFFDQYEKINYWMYKEEVHAELIKHEAFREYTIDQCRQDLDTLVAWGNLVPVQDTSKVTTVEEFKNKQFRYRLSEYSVEIERLTIRLENLHIEGASLESTLFEKLLQAIRKMKALAEEDHKTAGPWWRDLNNDFRRLNQNYQDYMSTFHSLKAEEIMRTKAFLVYKDKLVEYLREFVKELQRVAGVIEKELKQLDRTVINRVLDLAVEYELSIPRMDMQLDQKQLEDNIYGKWKSFSTWFLGDRNRESEVVRLFEITNEIIRKITRYAAQIVESRTSASNRKEEYKRLAEMFMKSGDMDEAHKLSSVVFGIFRTRHIQGDFLRSTDSIQSGVYDEPAFELTLRPKVRIYREKMQRSPIRSRKAEKEKQYREYVRRAREEQEAMNGYIQNNEIDISALPVIPPHIRTMLLSWIAKACIASDHKVKTNTGHVVTVIQPTSNKRCVLRCHDGELDMPAYKLIITEDPQ